MIQIINGCTIEGDPTRSLVGVDSVIGPLRNNGGPTLPHALLQRSPAIDVGNPHKCPPTDQRRYARPVDGDGDEIAICDIGAFDYGSAPP